MTPSQRVFVNTIAQYVRTLVNILISLYTVRIILNALGENDFGIYTLIAGVVAMLSFITNSLVGATQRFISFYQGKQHLQLLKNVFSNSLIINICFGLAVTLLLEFCGIFIFDGFLNIDSDRIMAAKIVYHFVVCMLFITFLSSPYRALLISHENIIYISLIDILDALLKLFAAFLLTILACDKLILYAVLICGIQFFNFLAYSIYSHVKYDECICPSIKNCDRSIIKEILKFTGWSVYGTACQIGQKEGIAIVLNKLMGTAVNAAYGIGFQVAGYTSFLSSAISNAIKPQITKAEGAGERKKAIWLSQINSKFVFFFMSMICIPCLFEINAILHLWLDSVPKYTSDFCVMVMLTLMADSLTVGLTTLNSAIGNIRNYTVWMNTPKLLTFPIAYILLKQGLSLSSVVILHVFVEFVMAMVRLPFLSKEAGLDIRDFLKTCILKEFFPTVVNVLVCCLIVTKIHCTYRFLITFTVSIISYGIAIYIWGLTKNERLIIYNLVSSTINRIKEIKKC